MLDVREEGPRVVAGYAWLAEPGLRAGELRIDHRDSRVERLVVTFG